VARRCPTCTVDLDEETVCRRCGTELGEIIAVEQAAERLASQALAALHAGGLEQASSLAERALRAHRCERSVRAAALAALVTRRFDRALALWGELRQGRSGSAATEGPRR
jgi:hypothetical protein